MTNQQRLSPTPLIAVNIPRSTEGLLPGQSRAEDLCFLQRGEDGTEITVVIDEGNTEKERDQRDSGKTRLSPRERR